MPTNWLIGLGAGLVSAVVFMSANTGALPLRYVLFALAPLAIALAGLGWGWITGAFAGVVATAAIALLTAHLPFAGLYVVTQALPMTVLLYLAGLSRASAPDDAASVEWYPVGRLVIWAAGLSAITAIMVLLALGAGEADFAIQLESKFADAIKTGVLPIQGATPLSDDDVATLARIAINVLPAVIAVSAMASLLLSLWISGLVTRASEQLQRPWPDLAAIAFPNGTALALAFATAATFLPEPFRMAGSTLVGTLVFAFLLLGLAVIHYVTRGNPWRLIALWALYIGVLFAYGVVFVVVLLGISETFLKLRQRFGGPPNTPTNPSD